MAVAARRQPRDHLCRCRRRRRQAAAGLAERLSDAGIANTIVSPLHGDDFNDDLRRGAVAQTMRAPAAAAGAASEHRRRVRSPGAVADEAA